MFKKRPSFGIVAVSGITVVIAMEIGVGELAIGIAAAYAAWEVLREGMPVAQAIAKAGDFG